MIASLIDCLVRSAVSRGVVRECDYYYLFNRICSLVGYEYDGLEFERLDLDVRLCVSRLVFEVQNNECSLTEGLILDVFMPLPSELNRRVADVGFLEFWYDLGVFTNYIKAQEIKRNVSFDYQGLDITINVSKPEKDPREIERLSRVLVSDYPKCPLCISNVGFFGNQKVDSRACHRTVKLMLQSSVWHLQFSPYQYYEKHLIVLSEEHVKMVTDDDTVEYLFDFNDLYEDLFIGCNADIPIVGGSILGHNHFQAGLHEFAMQRSGVITSFVVDDVDVEYLDWHLQAVRVSGVDRNRVSKVVNRFRNNFKNYQNESANIFNDGCNNAVNLITCKNGAMYVCYIIFRNNGTSNEYPYGFFHPTEDLHHIKKENIGLIEAMGMAILPGRLLDLDVDDFESYVGESFVSVLRCCDIFRFGVDDPISVIKSWGCHDD